ncbi:MAG TPA: hypothetical protein VG269_05385 [Tepidisphaeraceae bacterium]|jgi:chromosome segregation ATPase|nr:hypothetical protein [Tepidisphaeraceae bacterium]
MTRILQFVNLAGVLALAVLCGFQWTANRKAHLAAIDLEKIRMRQSATIDEQAATIRGYAADLDSFRDRLQASQAELAETQGKLRTTTAERDRATVERDELRTSRDSWMVAVAERDAAIKQAREQLEKLGKDRNEAVGKFNELAVKYNAIVKETNDARAKGAGSH